MTLCVMMSFIFVNFFTFGSGSVKLCCH